MLLNGDAVKSCTVLAQQADGADTITIEGIGTPEKLHPVQQALERGVSGLRSGARPAHLLLGILRADIGIVPRALELAGYDRADLLTRAREALAEEC